MKNLHPFHIVDQSPWPLTTSMSMLLLTFGMVSWFFMKSFLLLPLSMMMLSLSAYQWWRDISREATFQGLHTNKVVHGLQLGMILFIVSEVFFFISFFWAFLHSSLSPNIEVGMMWPPKSIHPFNPMQIPLLNTTILLSSGISITWAHHSILNNKFLQTKKALYMTLILGLYFTLLQGWEYHQAPFTMSDSIYGSTFFVSTGFHGLHVIIGSSLLLISLMRHNSLHFSKTHHFGFEASAWYWHFVDVVWLMLYIMIYWWGN